MTGEPELQPYQTGPWVSYLQGLLKHYGLWAGAEDGDFGDELRDVVRNLQTQYQLSPADGVVRADLWALLTGETAQSSAGHEAATAHPEASQHGHEQSASGYPASGYPAGHSGASQSGAGQSSSGYPAAAQGPSHPAAVGEHGMHGTGAQPQEDPVSMTSDGLPAFRYSLPGVPLAEAFFDTGELAVEMRLSLTGSLTVTFDHPAHGVTTTINDQTWRYAASQSLHGITEGVQVQGIGGQNVSISTTFGNQFEQTEMRYTPPNTLSFIGRCFVSYRIETDVTPATVQGSVGYQLDVTVTPHPSVPETEPEVVDEPSWVSRYGPAILTGALVVLVVVVAVAAAPETGGGSLLLLTEAEEMGAAF